MVPLVVMDTMIRSPHHRVIMMIMSEWRDVARAVECQSVVSAPGPPVTY